MVPYWPSQPWYPILTRRPTQRPVFMLARENLHAMLTNLEEKYRLLKTLCLSSAVPLANCAILPDCGMTGIYVALIKGSTWFHLDVLKFYVNKELLL